MAERRVTASGKDDDDDITSLCNDGEFWSPCAKADAIRDIERGTHEYYTLDRAGNRAVVYVVMRNGKKHLTTSPDGSTANNLDNLPDC